MSEERPQRSTWQSLRELLDPTYVPKAEAAPWDKVAKILQNISPKAWKELSKADRLALERLTESYGPTNRVRVFNTGEIGSAWFPQPKPFGKFGPLPHEWPYEAKTGSIYLGKEPTSMRGIYDPALSYAHEGGHVLHGPMNRWIKGGSMDVKEPVRAGMEGFAEGFSNSLLGRYGRESGTYYWPRVFTKETTPTLLRPYLESGKYGVDVGRGIREGRYTPNETIIDRLLDIISSYGLRDAAK